MTAGRTLFLSFIVIALILAVLVMIAPYRAMSFYMDCGNDRRALDSADIYINLHKGKEHGYSDKYADVLYSASELAVSMAESGNMRAAESGNRYIETYLAIKDIDERNKRIDEYNLLHSSPVLHPALFSVRAYLENAAYRCRLMSGETERITFDMSASDAVGLFGQNIVSADFDRICIVLQNLSSYCEAGNDITSGVYAEIYLSIKAAFPSIRNFVVVAPAENNMQLLRQCYYAGTVAAFVSYMYATDESGDWKTMDIMGDSSVSEWYDNTLMDAYLGKYNL